MTKKSPDHPLTEDQLSALVSPRSREVFGAFRQWGPMSVVELQGRLEFPSKTLYYQVKKLSAAGLVVLKSEAAGRKSPAVFEAIAERTYIADGFQGARYERLAAELAAASLRKAIKRVKAAAVASEADPSIVDSMHILTATLRLGPDDVAELQQRLKGLIDEFTDRQSGQEARRIGIVVSMAPD